MWGNIVKAMKIEYIFIKLKDDYCVSEEMFKNFLCGNNHIKFKESENTKSGLIVFDGKDIKYSLESADVEKSDEMFFHFMVEVSGEGKTQAQILEKLDLRVKEINEKNGSLFAINTIWNDVSLYYGKKLYPEILEVENILRKIIYIFMLKTVGSKWIHVGTPKKFQNSINDVIEKDNKTKNEIKTEWLTYADFITLGYFFTAPYSFKTDLKELFDELNQYASADALGDGKKCVDDELKSENKETAKELTSDIIKRISDDYEPKSNWERYFSDKLGDKGPKKFSEEWSSLYSIRNKVAHGRPINSNDFKKANVLINNFKTVFKKCIEIIDTLEISAEEANAVGAVAQQVIQNEKTDILWKENSPLEIKLNSSLDRLYSFNRMSGLNNIGNNIGQLGLSSVPKTAQKLSSMLSATYTFPNWPEFNWPILKVDKEGNYFINNEKFLQAAERANAASEPLLSQINKMQSLSETLETERITAALDKQIFIKPSISEPMQSESLNLDTAQKIYPSDIKETETISLENRKTGSKQHKE